MTGRIFFSLTYALALSLLISALEPAAMGQANVQGQWSTLPYSMPINPIHAALLSNGNVLLVAGSGNCPPSQSGCPSGPPYGTSNGSGALLLDPVSGQTISQFSLSWDMFCNGMVLLDDGRPFIAGGTIQYDPFHGEPKAATFDPLTNLFSDTPNMAHGRWYPTLLTLGDGRVMTFSGANETGGTNLAVEFYSLDTGWSAEYISSWTPDLYPRLHLLPNGSVFYSGAQTISKLFDPSTNTWNTNVATTNYSGTRHYGTSVLLPLLPSNNYDPKVIIMGGGNPATNTTEIIDMGASTPAWQYGPNMSQARIEMNAVILPNGKVLAVGGSLDDEDTNTASLNADLYDPVSNTFSSAGANAYPRLYHSVALLLPDATVWLAGGNPSRGSYVPQMEIYEPPYLFNPEGTLATRPSITSAPSSIDYGEAFAVSTPDAVNISSVVLVRNGTVTHAFGMDQREVGLSFTRRSGTLTVTAPPNANIAPPGYYMLFILDTSGIPSVASFVRVTATQPDFSVAAIPSSRTVLQGKGTAYSVRVTPSGGFTGNVSFGVTGLPTGATASFTPASVSSSGSSTLTVTTSSSTAFGTYTPTITATSGTLTHSTQVTLSVTAFSVTATPSSQNVLPGSGTTYNVSVTPSSGFTGNVSLSVTGLPTGASANFTPASVSGSGSSTLTVNTSTSTALGTYPLTIMATSGTLAYSTKMELAVTAFLVTATPSSQTVLQGNGTTYSVSVTPSSGFTSNVSFSVTGLPTGAAASFTPASVSSSGSSTLTVSTSTATPLGTYALTINATSGTLACSTNLKLTVAGFSVAVTPSSQTVLQGNGMTYSVSVTPSSGFTGNVSFSTTGLPTGATASFAPTSVSGSGSSILTVNTSTSTPLGTYTPTITATSGTVTRSTQVTLAVIAFSVTVTPSSRNVLQGNGTTYSVSVIPSSGFTGNVSFSMTGLPTGATASFTPASVSSSGSSTLTVDTSTSTPLGTYPLTMTATSGTLAYSTKIELAVTAFSVTVAPSSQNVLPGNGTTYSVSVTPSSGFTGNVSFSVIGLPAGAAASFTPVSVSSSGSSTLTLNTSTSTPLGNYPLTIMATSGILAYSTQVTLAVTGFSVAATPSAHVVSRGNGTSYSVSVTPVNGFTGNVSFSMTGLPTGATASFAPASISGSGSSIVTVHTSTSTPLGTYTLAITATSGTLSHTTQVELAMADFSIAVSPSSQTVNKNSSAAYTVTFSPLGPFAATVKFSVSRLPPGTSASFSPVSVTGAATSTLTISTSAVSPTGTYSLIVTAIGGGLTHSANLTLVIQ